jgi:hypothetical protein
VVATRGNGVRGCWCGFDGQRTALLPQGRGCRLTLIGVVVVGIGVVANVLIELPVEKSV